MKNKFNPGDDVWFFKFPEDGCGGFDVSQVELNVRKNIHEEELEGEYILYCYKTREEAVRAMLEQIIK